MNVIAFPENHPYPKRVDTANETYATEVIVILNEDDPIRADIVALVKRCLGYPE